VKETGGGGAIVILKSCGPTPRPINRSDTNGLPYIGTRVCKPQPKAEAGYGRRLKEFGGMIPIPVLSYHKYSTRVQFNSKTQDTIRSKKESGLLSPIATFYFKRPFVASHSHSHHFCLHATKYNIPLPHLPEYANNYMLPFQVINQAAPI